MAHEFALIRMEMAGMRSEMAGIRGEFVTQAMLHAEINRLLLWLFPTLLTALALVFAVAKLS
ncbi:MAG: hypothetical protein ACXVJW_14415 [Acidimicrobiia bacterium]